MRGVRSIEDFKTFFGHKCTRGFNPLSDLEKFGVINQTTMLASETREVMEILRKATIEKYGQANIQQHFADTSDTLCYATNENQSATFGLLETEADVALVVGGYNSSNTMHIVELLERKFPTYHVRDVTELVSMHEIRHFNQWEKALKTTLNWFPSTASDQPVTVALTSGASCPDTLVDEILMHIVSYFRDTKSIEEALEPYKDSH